MDNFQTFTEYLNNSPTTYNEEDYIEMIYRLKDDNKITNLLLATNLNVKPSSITKMTKKLIYKNLLEKTNSGEIKLSKEGLILGKKCIERHKTVEEFLINIGIKDNLLGHTEMIEHTFDDQISRKIEMLNDIFKNYPFIKNILKNK